jgi:hypothetical protein
VGHRRFQRLLDLLLDERLPEDEVRTKLRVVEEQRSPLTAFLAAAEERAAAQLTAATRLAAVRAFCASLEPRLDRLNATPEGQRSIYLRCLDLVRVQRGGPLEIQTAIPPDAGAAFGFRPRTSRTSRRSRATRWAAPASRASPACA